jgi:DeoR/GlpR family transcriptional regulator of sugar metabolism
MVIILKIVLCFNKVACFFGKVNRISRTVKVTGQTPLIESEISVFKPRRRQLLAHVEHAGACSYEELTDLLQVSTMTIRRDVDALAKQGRLIKTLGGVQRAGAPQTFYEGHLHDRIQQRAPQKRAIARAAMELIEAPQTLFVDGSTTCLELVKLLARQPHGLTLVTCSTLVCHEFGKTGEGVVVGLGGQYDAASFSFVGPEAEDGVGRFFVDLAILSAKGFIAEDGTYEAAVGTLRIKQRVARQAAKIALLVDGSKFGQRALSKVLDIGEIDVVITDDGAPRAAIARLRDAGRQVLVASIDTSPSTSHRTN